MRRPGKKTSLNEVEIGDPNHSYAYAVALLARRDYSTRELRKKLQDRGYLEGAIEPVLIDLPHRQHHMRVRLRHAVGADIPMHTEIGDHSAIDKLVADEVAGERNTKFWG